MRKEGSQNLGEGEGYLWGMGEKLMELTAKCD
jgi:hypothetical protein